MGTMIRSWKKRLERKVCKRAKGNKTGIKCKHSGSCNGSKKCKFAIY